MEVLRPRTLTEALDQLAERPGALPIAGGTDVMVERKVDRHRPEAIIDVSRLPQLKGWWDGDGYLFLGSGVTYSQIMRDLPASSPRRGFPHGRLAPDPEPGDGRREPRYRLAGRRRLARPGRVRRRDPPGGPGGAPGACPGTSSTSA